MRREYTKRDGGNKVEQVKLQKHITVMSKCSKSQICRSDLLSHFERWNKHVLYEAGLSVLLSVLVYYLVCYLVHYSFLHLSINMFRSLADHLQGAYLFLVKIT
jgi:hypothetical protein